MYYVQPAAAQRTREREREKTRDGVLKAALLSCQKEEDYEGFFVTFSLCFCLVATLWRIRERGLLIRAYYI